MTEELKAQEWRSHSVLDALVYQISLTRNLEGKFIVIEGIDGAGKTSALSELRESVRRLNAGGAFAFYKAVEYGSNAKDRTDKPIVAPAIDNMLANLPPKIVQALLYTAGRSEVNMDIGQALAEKKIVMCDRYCGATYAYQGFPEITLHKDTVIKPDLCVIFNMSDLKERHRRVEARKVNPSPYHLGQPDEFYRMQADKYRECYDRLNVQHVVELDGCTFFNAAQAAIQIAKVIINSLSA